MSDQPPTALPHGQAEASLEDWLEWAGEGTASFAAALVDAGILTRADALRRLDALIAATRAQPGLAPARMLARVNVLARASAVLAAQGMAATRH